MEEEEEEKEEGAWYKHGKGGRGRGRRLREAVLPQHHMSAHVPCHAMSIDGVRMPIDCVRMPINAHATKAQRH